MFKTLRAGPRAMSAEMGNMFGHASAEVGRTLVLGCLHIDVGDVVVTPEKALKIMACLRLPNGDVQTLVQSFHLTGQQGHGRTWTREPGTYSFDPRMPFHQISFWAYMQEDVLLTLD